MKPAEFEEKEYEAPLYNQLERGSSLVWTPGQVLEAQVGFDRSAFIADEAVWEVLGYAGVPQGIVLSRTRLLSWWGPPRHQRSLPSFRLNLFVQAKRSNFGSRPPKAARQAGFSGSTWAFHVDSLQQTLLEVLTAKCGRRAVITYAAPVFHAVQDLYRHTVKRTLVQNSTFPTSSALSGHWTWYYQVAGAIGFANPEPEFIEEPPLEDRLLEALLAAPQSGGISGIWEAIAATVSDSRLQDHPRMALFSNARLVLSRLLESTPLDQPAREYAEVALFCHLVGLQWLVVEKKPILAA
jgi:hypothetical protein